MTRPAYERVYWRGVTLDRFTMAFIDEVEADLGRPIDSVYQGSYNAGVTNSAGTHDAGGALDCWDRDPAELVRLMRKHGGASWNRAGRGNWVDHIHVIVMGDDKMSPEAHDQVVDYLAGGDALSPYDGTGDYHPRPSPIKPFDYGGSQQPKWADGDVYVDKLRRGTRDSDSVRRLQYRLLHHPDVPARKVTVNGHYDNGTVSAVMHWQRVVMQVPPKYDDLRDGTELNNRQANRLFGDAYTIYEIGGKGEPA